VPSAPRPTSASTARSPGASEGKSASAGGRVISAPAPTEKNDVTIAGMPRYAALTTKLDSA
jgi:hypothetical protein